MQIDITNIRSLRSASLPIDGISLIVGRNGVGKTTILHSIAAVLGGVRQPLGSNQADTVACMVRDGAKNGTAVLTVQGAKRSIQWNRGKSVRIEVAEEGHKSKLPHASELAVGTWQFATAPAKERASMLAHVCKTAPTKIDVGNHFEVIGLNDVDLDEIWQTIEREGWDATADQAAKDAQVLKGRWQEAAGGENWGQKKALTFEPEGWTPDDPEKLKARIADLTQELETAISRKAIDEESRAEAEAHIERAEKAKLAQADIEKDRAALLEEMRGWDEKQKELRSRQKELSCPCCGAVLVLVDSALHESQTKADASADDDAKVTAEINRINSALDELGARMARVNIALENERKARELLDGDTGPIDEGRARETIEGELEQARVTLHAIEAGDRCSQINDDIITALEVKKACATDGIRKTKLVETLHLLNSRLAEADDPLNIGRIEIAEDMTVYAGRRPHHTLSESQQWWVDIVIQVELCRTANEPMIVADRFDIFGIDLRGPIMKWLAEQEIPAVVMMTVGKKQEDYQGIPDLRAAGMGATYLIEDGVMSPWGQAAARAAA